jgi:hypothetical protein
MILFKEIPFNFEDEDYKIRVYYEENLVNVVAFRNNYPANGFRHQIKVPSYVSAEDILKHDMINTYVDVCKEDISRKRWERLIGANKDKGELSDICK